MSLKLTGIFLFTVILLTTGTASGQSEKLDDLIEKSAELLETEQDYSEVGEEQAIFESKPVNLNEAKKEEDLNTIPFLSSAQRKGLLDYLVTYSEVLSIYELQSISGFDSVMIQKIRPFISISPPSHVPPPTPANLFRFGHHDLIIRYEQAFPRSAGYLAYDSTQAPSPDSPYPGGPQRYYFRYIYSWFDKLKIGIAGEKDPGEQFFKGAQSKGMDFYAAFLCISNLGILKNLTIGNFRVSFGQGLTFGSGLSLGSTPGFSSGYTMSRGVRPSVGMNEGSYLRGLSATVKIKHVEIIGFASLHPRDATISLANSATSEDEVISSFTTSGYHRTQPELARKDAVNEFVCGGNISITLAPTQQFGFKLGLTTIYCHYSATLEPNHHSYNQFSFHGDKNLNTGFDFQVRLHGVYLFGEISRSRNRGIAWLSGATVNPDPRVGITLIYRSYQEEYQNLFANAFGQNSLNNNERGIYGTVTAAITPRITLAGYIDLFSFPWLKYRVDIPVNGQEFGIMADWQRAGNIKITLKFYQKNLRGNQSDRPDQVVHKLSVNFTRTYRTGLELFPIPGLMLKTRIEVKEAGETNIKHSLGYLVFQEVQIKMAKKFEAITMRFGLFDIPDYASRIYVYEPEVLYGYSVPAYQGRGVRGCLVMKYRVTRKTDIWLRGAITSYSDRTQSGTGPDQTQGSVRGELTAQLMIRL